MAVGYIQTSDQAKQYLQNMRGASGSRTFGSLYAANELAGAKAAQNVEQQYGEQIGNAYRTAMAQKSSVLSSNLGTGYKEALLGDTEAAINTAYETYMSKLAESEQDIATSVSDANQAVTDELNTQAENVLNYQQKHFDYAQNLWDINKSTMSEEDFANFATGIDWKNYTTLDFGEDTNAKAIYDRYAQAKELGLLTDEQWNEISKNFAQYYRLKTRDELAMPEYIEEVDPETGNTYKHWSSIVDNEGNLTEAGINYYDFLENYAATRQDKGQSWEEYLSENDPELLDWAKTYNPYLAGTDDATWAGTMRTAQGTMSTDYTYTFLERFGGLSKKDVDTVFADAYKYADKTVDEINTSDIKGFIQHYRTLAEQMGLQDVDWEAVEKDADMYLQQIKSQDDEIHSAKGMAAAHGVGSILLAVGSALTAVFTGNAVAAGISYAATSAAITGIYNDVKRIEQMEGNKKAQEDAYKQLYMNQLIAMVNEVQSKKREQQIREYKSQR